MTTILFEHMRMKCHQKMLREDDERGYSTDPVQVCCRPKGDFLFNVYKAILPGDRTW